MRAFVYVARAAAIACVRKRRPSCIHDKRRCSAGRRVCTHRRLDQRRALLLGGEGTAARRRALVFVCLWRVCVCAHEARTAAVITAAPGPGETRARPTSANNVVNIRRRANVLRRLTAGISYLVMTQTSAEKLANFEGKFQDIEEILAVS